MDIIAKTFERITWWARDLDPQFVAFLFRLLALYGLATLGCGVLLLRGNRSVVVQILWAVSAIVLSAILPLERVRIDQPVAKTWLLLVTSILLAVLPALLARVLVPTFQTQQKLQKALYLLLGLLFLAHFIGGDQ